MTAEDRNRGMMTQELRKNVKRGRIYASEDRTCTGNQSGEEIHCEEGLTWYIDERLRLCHITGVRVDLFLHTHTHVHGPTHTGVPLTATRS